MVHHRLPWTQKPWYTTGYPGQPQPHIPPPPNVNSSVLGPAVINTHPTGGAAADFTCLAAAPRRRASTRGDTAVARRRRHREPACHMHTGVVAPCASHCPPPRTTATDFSGSTVMMGALSLSAVVCIAQSVCSSSHRQRSSVLYNGCREAGTTASAAGNLPDTRMDTQKPWFLGCNCTPEGPLNNLLWYVPSSRYIWRSAPILFLQEQIKDIIIIWGAIAPQKPWFQG
jgi:hypothetical protein